MIGFGPPIKNYDANHFKALISSNFRKAPVYLNSREQWKGGTQSSNLILNHFAIQSK